MHESPSQHSCVLLAEDFVPSGLGFPLPFCLWEVRGFGLPGFEFVSLPGSQRLPATKQLAELWHFLLIQLSEQHCRLALHFLLRHLQFEHLFLLHFPEQHLSGCFSLHLLPTASPHLSAFGHLEHFPLLQSLLLKQAHVFGYFLPFPRGP